MTASTFNYEAIAAAISTAFQPAAVGTPANEAALVQTTHLLPENLIQFPICIVFPFRSPAEFAYPPYTRVTSNGLIWPVRVFFDNNTPLPQRTQSVYRWATQLTAIFPVSSNIDLGLGAYVHYAEVTSIAIGTYDYPASSVVGEVNTRYQIVEVNVYTPLEEKLA